MQKKSMLLALALITLVAGTLVLYEPVIHHKFINYDDGVCQRQPPRARRSKLGKCNMGIQHYIFLQLASADMAILYVDQSILEG